MFMLKVTSEAEKEKSTFDVDANSYGKALARRSFVGREARKGTSLRSRR
jgi:hypothetical protein